MTAAVLIWLCVGATKEPCLAGTPTQCTHSLDNPAASSRTADISPDGTLVAMATSLGTYVANIQTGVYAWSESTSVTAEAAAFSPDGRFLVIASGSGTGQGTKVVDLVSGAIVWQDTSKPASAVDYSPDGTKVVSGNGDGSIEIRDAASGAVLQTLSAGQGTLVRRVRYSPDGTLIMTAVDTHSSFKIWDAASGTQLRSLWYPGPTGDVQFSPDSTLIAATNTDLAVVIWKTDGTKVRTLTVATAWPSWHMSVVFSHDGTRLFVGLWGSIEEWDVSTGTKLAALDVPYTKWVHGLALSPDGNTLVSALRDESHFLVWDVSPPAPPLAP